MQQYYFLFTIAFIWIVFATIQDFKKREIANWLNFSLIAFALAYRAFYSIAFSTYTFFLYGILGLILFIILGNIFYYARVFAGGDAKLLMALGAILPFESYSSLVYTTFSFLLILFFLGAIYSLLYSFFIYLGNKKKFLAEFKKLSRENKYLLLLSIIALVIALLIQLTNASSIYNLSALAYTIFFLVIFLFPLLYLYLQAIDKCMIKLTPASKLTEGDWIINDIKLKNKIIKKSVHGLSSDDIKLLKKQGKKVLIRQGIPFTPSFLFAFMTMVFFFSTSRAFPFFQFLF